MDYQWEDINWIFKIDGTLRDIYVQNVTIGDWKKLVDFLNENFLIKFGSDGLPKIDKSFVVDYLLNRIETESKIISIFIDEILINCFLFSLTEIEFDIEPSEIVSKNEFQKICDFMNSISQVLGKKVILTGENQMSFPLISIDCLNKQTFILTESQAINKWSGN